MEANDPFIHNYLQHVRLDASSQLASEHHEQRALHVPLAHPHGAFSSHSGPRHRIVIVNPVTPCDAVDVVTISSTVVLPPFRERHERIFTRSLVSPEATIFSSLVLAAGHAVALSATCLENDTFVSSKFYRGHLSVLSLRWYLRVTKDEAMYLCRKPRISLHVCMICTFPFTMLYPG
jgi:hypothetical protein